MTTLKFTGISKKPIYNVYVDETFEHFLNLPRMDGYLCYSALMIPEEREQSLADFGRRWMSACGIITKKRPDLKYRANLSQLTYGNLKRKIAPMSRNGSDIS